MSNKSKDQEEKAIGSGTKSIYSTLSNDQSFPKYISKKGNKVSAAKVETAILIKGGANVANKHSLTSKVIETKVSNEDFKVLEKHPAFKRMIKRGFFSLEKPSSPKKDKCAPLNDKDIEAKNAKAVVKTNEDKPEQI